MISHVLSFPSPKPAFCSWILGWVVGIIAVTVAQGQDPTRPVLIEIGTLQAQMKYDTEQFTVPPNVQVKVVLKNSDDLPHNLVICDREGVSMAVSQVAWELGEKGFEKQWVPEDDRVLAATGMVDPQKSGALTFKSPKKEGRYDFVCTYPGHAVLMKGVMIVRAGGEKQSIPPKNSGPIRELTYTVYKGNWNRMPDFAGLQPEATDSVANGLIDLATASKMGNRFGVVFDGLINAPEAGEFTFSTASDDGSQVFVDDQIVVNNDGVHGRADKSGKVNLTAGTHRLRVTYFERDGEESLEVRWNGPGIKGKQGRLSKRPARQRQNREVTGIPLIPKHRAILYRNFIEGVGNRAIGVGFPGGVSLAFDADQVRLALMWTGDFIDAARHWSGRGQGNQPPAGDNIVAAPPGEGFALLDAPTSAWPEPTPRAINTRFTGYRLWDKAGSPEFLYRVADTIDVVDRCVGVASHGGKRSLQRQLTIKGATKNGKHLCMRIASGEIAAEKDSSYLSAAGQLITITGAESTLNGHDLIVPVNLSSGNTTFTITYDWLSAADQADSNSSHSN